MARATGPADGDGGSADAGMLTVAAGAVFKVELGSARGAGCMWEPLPLPGGVRLLTTGFPERASGTAVGDGAAQVFELLAQLPGRLQLRFVLKRRWEATPVETRVVDVEVH